MKNKPVTFLYGPGYITVDNGVITSDRIKDPTNPVSPEYTTFNAAVDGLESLLLALHCEGVDLTTKAVDTAVVTALDAILLHHIA